MIPDNWKYPLYAAMIHDDLRCEIIGGPFVDIDDVLDVCWDRWINDDLEVERCFVVEMGAGYPMVRSFPEEAFPARDCSSEAAG